MTRYPIPLAATLRRVAGVVFVALTIGPLTCSPAMADGVGWPGHTVSGITCDVAYGQGIVRANPPSDVRSWYGTDFPHGELADWVPVLYRWDGTQYVKWVEPGNWAAYALVSSFGIDPNPDAGGWRSYTTQGQLLFLPFTDLPAGTYTVLNRIRWQSTGEVHDEWSADACAIA